MFPNNLNPLIVPLPGLFHISVFYSFEARLPHRVFTEHRGLLNRELGFVTPQTAACSTHCSAALALTLVLSLGSERIIRHYLSLYGKEDLAS